jgi:hypothetical protein
VKRRDSAEASARKPITVASAKTAMETFKDFARKLLMVPRDQFESEERRYQSKKPKRRKRRP